MSTVESDFADFLLTFLPFASFTPMIGIGIELLCNFNWSTWLFVIDNSSNDSINIQMHGTWTNLTKVHYYFTKSLIISLWFLSICSILVLEQIISLMEKNIYNSYLTKYFPYQELDRILRSVCADSVQCWQEVRHHHGVQVLFTTHCAYIRNRFSLLVVRLVSSHDCSGKK